MRLPATLLIGAMVVVACGTRGDRAVFTPITPTSTAAPTATAVATVAPTVTATPLPTTTPSPPATPTPPPASGPITIAYGEGPSRFGELSVPLSAGPFPVIVLIHGGFWRAAFDSSLMMPLADDLVERGYAVWNIEYGRVGEAAGGWPHTFVDVAAAVDHLGVLATEHRLDLDAVGVVGHSAGGHLAAWIGGRGELPADAPGADPLIEPRLLVGLGAIIDLRSAAIDGLGNDAVVGLLAGQPSTRPERYEIATPRPAGPALVLVNGGEDTIVPPRYSTLDGLPARTLTIDGADHFDLIDPASSPWAQVIDVLAAELPVTGPQN